MAHRATAAPTTTDSSDGVAGSSALLNPGTYKVSFSASGFKTAEVPSVIGEHVDRDAGARSGSSSVGGQTTEVSGRIHRRDHSDSRTSPTARVVGSQEVVDLPLVSRNYTQIY